MWPASENDSSTDSVTKVRLWSAVGPTKVADSLALSRSVLEIRTLPRIRRSRSVTRRLATRQSTVLAGLLVGAASMALAACGSGSSPGSAPTTDRPATSTSTTQAPTGPAGSALAAYRSMWADMVTASRTSDYKSPLLAENASGEALSVLVQGLAKNQAQGVVTRGDPVLDPSVTSLTPAGNPTQATISDCFDDTHWLDYKVTGGLANSTPGGHRATMAVVVDTSGSWKVTQLAVQAIGTC